MAGHRHHQGTESRDSNTVSRWKTERKGRRKKETYWESVGPIGCYPVGGAIRIDDTAQHPWIYMCVCAFLPLHFSLYDLREALSSFSASPTSLLRRRELGGFTSVFIYAHVAYIHYKYMYHLYIYSLYSIRRTHTHRISYSLCELSDSHIENSSCGWCFIQCVNLSRANNSHFFVDSDTQLLFVNVLSRHFSSFKLRQVRIVTQSQKCRDCLFDCEK